MTATALSPQRLHFPNTASNWGRFLAVSPNNSDLNHLNYARIRLGAEKPSIEFDTDSRETGFICLSGSCKISLKDTSFELGQYDGVYIPRDEHVLIESKDGVDLTEVSAVVEGQYPLQIVRYSETSKDPSLCFKAGGESTTRHLNIVIGKNVKAGRIVAGFTRSQPGHWTSWPPHEHGKMLEEVYVYFDMPAPAFGIQMVYNETQRPEVVQVVHDGDAVLMPSGYHPNVSVPGHPINFVWMMAAHREVEDRQFGVVNVQPGFDGAGSGLEASRR